MIISSAWGNLHVLFLFAKAGMSNLAILVNPVLILPFSPLSAVDILHFSCGHMQLYVAGWDPCLVCYFIAVRCMYLIYLCYKTGVEIFCPLQFFLAFSIN
jgi:hypothetical protein